MITNKELVKSVSDEILKQLFGLAHYYMSYRKEYYKEDLTLDEAITRMREDLNDILSGSGVI